MHTLLHIASSKHNTHPEPSHPCDPCLLLRIRQFFSHLLNNTQIAPGRDMTKFKRVFLLFRPPTPTTILRINRRRRPLPPKAPQTRTPNQPPFRLCSLQIAVRAHLVSESVPSPSSRDGEETGDLEIPRLFHRTLVVVVAVQGIGRRDFDDDGMRAGGGEGMLLSILQWSGDGQAVGRGDVGCGEEREGECALCVGTDFERCVSEKDERGEDDGAP
ncbi:hypothetical protein BT69DRAFT_608440 [Atractiella rhizophila]|nr:hypothetical protein BT69DRAFT_608440 [Atractiella rhizophila]